MLTMKGLFSKGMRLSIAFVATLAFTSCSHATKRAQPVDAEETSESQKDESESASSASRLRIMSYNVLRYGCGCQEDNSIEHQRLSHIIKHASPDVAGLVKVDAIGHGKNGAPVGFADSILKAGMNTAFPDRYAVCPFTNTADANNINLLFYDHHKLGYAGMETLAVDETDFNLFRLYLQSSVSNGSKDTVFVYFVLNHTESGDNAQKRDRQMAGVMAALHHRFTKMPNVIDMGDFNLRNTEEAGYKSLTADADAAFRFADPPFAIDHSVTYPADWEKEPDAYARFLTTATRKKDDEPNKCGTGGGAKFWYDHILLSPAIASGKNGLSYQPNSFRVIGNDGNRVGRSVNAGKHPNTAVPAGIAEDLFQLSNKYPVMLELAVKAVQKN